MLFTYNIRRRMYPSLVTKVWFLSRRFPSSMSIYSLNILSFVLATKGIKIHTENVIYRLHLKIEVWFFFCFKISVINEHIFYQYFVRWSVAKATKGKNVKKKKCDFLDPNFNFLYFIHTNIFLIISNRFDTYWCCHPCLCISLI